MSASRNINHVDGVHLLKLIANKDEDLEAAKDAFNLFVGYFEDKIKTLVEVNARNLGYDDKVAFEALICTFNKVWLYPSFSMMKSHLKDEEQAIIVWLMKIASSQMFQYLGKGVCAQIKEEDDLSVIEDSEAFVDSFKIQDLDPDTKMKYVMALNDKMSQLGEKHKIIYMTYKAYYLAGKTPSRAVLASLRNRLGITQVTVRVYKKEACEILNDFTIMKP